MLLGGFDGLHVGHKKLVERAKTLGLPIGIMTISQGKGAKNLFTETERQRMFAEQGIDFVFELPFAEIKDLSPEAFMSLLQKEFQPTAFVCGDDFRFGKGAVGSAETLKRGIQVRVEVEKLLVIDGEKASATTVKNALAVGDIQKANKVLGEPFFLFGTVVKDRGIGRTLGFPTANILYPEEKYALKQGVYETRVEMDGKTYACITNYGTRPTFADAHTVTETYIDGFSGDLYGRELCIRFVRFLRDVQKFESVKTLQTQLQEDIRRVRCHD